MSSFAFSVEKCTATVLSVARPSAPPTCCMVLSTPDAMPESRAADTVHGAQRHRDEDQPMPSGISTMNGSRSVA